MTDDFLTEGLRKDRYLKALRLSSQFDDEIRSHLQQFDREMVDQQPELFDSEVTPNWNSRTSQTSGGTLAYHRFNHPMTGPAALDGDEQRLNVHLYWMPPTEYGRTNIDGALRAYGYKIKGGDKSVDTEVVEQTRAGDWSLRMSENPFDSNIAFYKHVSSSADIEETQSELVDHFAEFGDRYGTS